MILSDLSIRRPVICTVACLLVILIGVLTFNRLPVREYPNVESPSVSVSTTYRGASAEVVETKVTDPLEKQLSAVEGIKIMRSTSSEQSSRIAIEFDLNRNIDEAANDVRDLVARVRLPDEVDRPRISKVDPDTTPVVTLSFNSDVYDRLEIVELIENIVLPRIQTVPGVGSVQIDGERYAMRLWIDSDRLAAYNLTVADVQSALQRQNVEVPGGRIESQTREFPVRLMGSMSEVSDFENLVLATRGDYQVKFRDIGRVELGAEDYRSTTYFNGRLSVGVQILRQPSTNLLELCDGVKALIPVFQQEMPEGIVVELSKDDSAYVERTVDEVYNTLYEATFLVVLVIFLFLRNWRATLIPLVAVPVSLVGTVAIIATLGFSINILTLLACVLAIGLVVDDAIVMLENIYRRIEAGEKPVSAALHGARQVAFAIVATTLTLAAVFLPVAFQSGQTGRLFFEFGITLVVAVIMSSVVALTMSPMLCSRLLLPPRPGGGHGWFYDRTEPFFVALNRGFDVALRVAVRWRWGVFAATLAMVGLGGWLYTQLQRELIPAEDRGVFTANLRAPVGSTPQYMDSYGRQLEQEILKIPEIDRTFQRQSPGRAYVTGTLDVWEDRERTTQDVISDVRKIATDKITGVQVTVGPKRPFGGGGGPGRGSALQLVLMGSQFDELQVTGETFLDTMRESELFGPLRLYPSPTKPQLDVRIDRDKAADLGVPVSDIATTLETLLGSRRVTQFQRGSQQYYVILQVESTRRMTPHDLSRIYVRSSRGHLVQLSNLVSWNENAVPESYPHFNRLRSVTLSAPLADGVTMGDAVMFLQGVIPDLLPAGSTYAWDGPARQFIEGAGDTYMLFGLALLFTFLILAAQFESWVHPFTIFTGVAIAVSGGIIVLYATRFWGPALTDNLFARFGLIMLIGLIAKNGILIVEFANQLQIDDGLDAATAAFRATTIRFRPILMTSVSTILGAVPIAFAQGAGAEIRNPLGLVIVGGLAISTVMTLFVVPIVYTWMDSLCVRLTGKNSAHGLKRAAEIRGDLAGAPSMAATHPAVVPVSGLR
ncbi:efflux RND transporter permease subunit [Synoicihabitans lomoniglobus]|uniref:Efflux RND transporter permease subunit n=1 Tax=Synoicihabitans lomoniglobus TaxID=2909285 RepID=A0AAF0CQ52_9BACT|nr:efflux RND transporter permease subunit [Opitutaceae bacterium LMO-M01]WED66010.1 efflux RND transporter permease subunit [Opitutaceae bacterium LMO-M01]